MVLCYRCEQGGDGYPIPAFTLNRNNKDRWTQHELAVRIRERWVARELPCESPHEGEEVWYDWYNNTAVPVPAQANTTINAPLGHIPVLHPVLEQE
jgi:hypothetical protein